MNDFPFLKMHGTGNDFVVLDALQNPLPRSFDFARAAMKLCARGFGIGGDGLLTLEDAQSGFPNCAARMRMWNPDGTEDMCGNGLRCIGLLARTRHLKTDDFLLQTLAGAREIRVTNADEIRVEMGAPRFTLSQIPMTPNRDYAPREYSPQNEKGYAIEYDLPLPETTISRVTSLSTGSAHTVVFAAELPDEKAFGSLSPRIENHVWFPERTSVMWAKMRSRQEMQLRIWERGVGETLACGTGACAAAVAAIVTKRADENAEVAVESRGGTLRVAWHRERGITMQGAARFVYEGEAKL